jgi:hypothetical protein
MDALDQSKELMRRSDELRARSVQICAAADETVEKSWRLTFAAANAREAVRRARGESAGRSERALSNWLAAGR